MQKNGYANPKKTPNCQRLRYLHEKFVFVGRNERRKGIEELNAAIRQLKTEKLPPYEIHFIGPIPREHQLTGDHIFYHGEIRDTQKIKELLRASDILICPSHSEGMPNVILEGMASGLGCYCHRCGGCCFTN